MLRSFWVCLALLTFTLNAIPAGPNVPQFVDSAKETLLYARLTNVSEFVERFKSTGGGRMFSDPQLKRLSSICLQRLVMKSINTKEKLGISWDELLQILKAKLPSG